MINYKVECPNCGFVIFDYVDLVEKEFTVVCPNCKTEIPLLQKDLTPPWFGKASVFFQGLGSYPELMKLKNLRCGAIFVYQNQVYVRTGLLAKDKIYCIDIRNMDSEQLDKNSLVLCPGKTTIELQYVYMKEIK